MSRAGHYVNRSPGSFYHLLCHSQSIGLLLHYCKTVLRLHPSHPHSRHEKQEMLTLAPSVSFIRNANNRTEGLLLVAHSPQFSLMRSLVLRAAEKARIQLFPLLEWRQLLGKGLGSGSQASRNPLTEMPLTQERAAVKSAPDTEAWSFTQDLCYSPRRGQRFASTQVEIQQKSGFSKASGGVQY